MRVAVSFIEIAPRMSPRDLAAVLAEAIAIENQEMVALLLGKRVATNTRDQLAALNAALKGRIQPWSKGC